MKRKVCVVTIALALVSSGRLAGADTVEITYASGKVQTVELVEKAKDVKDIKLKEVNALPLPEKIQNHLGANPARRADQKEAPPAKTPSKTKSGPTFMWAPPLSE